MTITFKKINKDYDGKVVLSDINFNVESREFFVLVGESGGGKTTLLKMINRLIEPSSGEILIDNEPISQLNLRKLRLQIGYVLQQIALFPNLTVLENIALIPQMKGWSKEKIRARVEELLPLVGLSAEKYLLRYPHELSGGEAQRVGILRAIAAEPKIILMDEPFSALDPISRKQLQDLVKKLQQELKITTVFVTHDISEAMLLADHIAIVKSGVMQQIGTPEALLTKPSNAYVASFFADFQQDLSKIPLADLTNFLTEKKTTFTAETPLSEVVKSLAVFDKTVKNEKEETKNA